MVRRTERDAARDRERKTPGVCRRQHCLSNCRFTCNAVSLATTPPQLAISISRHFYTDATQQTMFPPRLHEGRPRQTKKWLHVSPEGECCTCTFSPPTTTSRPCTKCERKHVTLLHLSHILIHAGADPTDLCACARIPSVTLSRLTKHNTQSRCYAVKACVANHGFKK
jgi:hypothetical protein